MVSHGTTGRLHGTPGLRTWPAYTGRPRETRWYVQPPENIDFFTCTLTTTSGHSFAGVLSNRTRGHVIRTHSYYAINTYSKALTQDLAAMIPV
jgi:hypothetical protein